MRLVDDGLIHGSVQGAVAIPVIIMRIDDDTAHGGREIVIRTTGIGSIPEAIRIAPGIRINQHLVTVIAISSSMYIRKTVNPIGIMDAGLDSSHVDVPEMEGLVLVRVQLNGMDWLRVIVLVEQ